MTGIDVPVKIYTNDGEDHFMGFHNEFANNPELTLVFKCELHWEDPFTGRFPFDVLDFVYDQTQAGLGTTVMAVQYDSLRLRSLSVGDVVSVGETAFACEAFGWKKISTEELENAIIWDDTEDKK